MYKHSPSRRTCFPFRPKSSSSTPAVSLAESRKLSIDVWVAKQHEDPDLHELRRMILDQRRPTTTDKRAASHTLATYLPFFADMFIDEHNILFLRRILTSDAGTTTKRTVVLVPKTLRFDVMKIAHVGGAHFGVNATVRRAQKYVYFPLMAKTAKEVVDACRECVEKSKAPAPQRHTLKSLPSGRPWSHLTVDFVGPLPRSRRQNEHILTMKCSFTKWVEAIPCRRTNAETVVRILTEDILPRLGWPESIQSDNGGGFSAHLTQEVAAALRIPWTRGTPYHPQSQSVERFHKDLGAALRAFAHKNPTDWDVYLPVVLLAVRSSVSEVTKASPAQLMYGRDLRLPIDLMYGLPSVDQVFSNAQQYAQDLKNKIQRSYRFARENMRLAVARQRQAYTEKIITYQIGDRVWLFSPRTVPGPRKLQCLWTGPWTILRVVNPVVFEISSDPRWNIKKELVVSIDRLRRFVQAPNEDLSVPPSSSQNLNSPFEGDEFGELPLISMNDAILDADTDDEEDTVRLSTTKDSVEFFNDVTSQNPSFFREEETANVDVDQTKNRRQPEAVIINEGSDDESQSDIIVNEAPPDSQPHEDMEIEPSTASTGARGRKRKALDVLLAEANTFVGGRSLGRTRSRSRENQVSDDT